MTLGIVIGVAIYAALDFMCELFALQAEPEPGAKMPCKQIIMRNTAGQVAWYVIRTPNFEHKVNPN